MNEADFSETQLELFDVCEPPRGGTSHAFSYGKTYRARLGATGEMIFAPCLKKSRKAKFQFLQVDDGQPLEWYEAESVTPLGASWTLNFGECPKEEKGYSLSQILEPVEDVPTKYYLSARACAGILRRAEKRGKELPPELKAALEMQAGIA